MSWVASAIGGSALIGAGASIYSSGVQADSAQKALDFQKQQAAQTRTDMSPWMQSGQQALGQVNDIRNGAPGWDNFLRSPDYQFAQSEGMNALQNSAASRGGLLSGNFLRGAQQFGQGLASQQFGNYYNRLNDASKLGQTSAAGMGALSAQTSNQIGQTQMGVGAAQASGAVGLANTANGAASNYLMYKGLSSYGNNGGGGGYLPQGGSYGGWDPNVPGGWAG